ncbi:unnamed protein product [Ambrosiozyma monospora]|uniref:Unnamed protein product n=1 Tax=Ambrosiozyma monospora TaxID=43982 RepID=A0ACB5T1B2_AMBMO|nr:unnamed protein product [Ambrosiozyma monospora]
MSDSEDINNKHTFLSRVFGLNSTYNPANSNPLLNDDNNDLQFSIQNFQNNFEDEDEYDSDDDDDENYEDYRNHRQNDDLRSSGDVDLFSKETDNFFKKYQNDTPYSRGKVKKNKYPAHVSVNVHSENEDSSSDDDDDHGAGSGTKDRSYSSGGSFSKRSTAISSQEKLRKQNIKAELEREYEDEALDLVPESLLLESGGKDNKPPFRKISKSSRKQKYKSSPLYSKSKTGNSLSNNKKRTAHENPFMEQILEAGERSMTPSLLQLGESAKNFATRTLNSIPRAIPRPSAFNSPMSPPITGYRDDDSKRDIEMGPLGDNNPNNQQQYARSVGSLSPMERALWVWSNVTNLDVFLEDVYQYYVGNGYYCILLSKTSDLLIIVFVVWLTSFMGNCINYQKLMHTNVHKLNDALVCPGVQGSERYQEFLQFVVRY